MGAEHCREHIFQMRWLDGADRQPQRGGREVKTKVCFVGVERVGAYRPLAVRIKLGNDLGEGRLPRAGSIHSPST